MEALQRSIPIGLKNTIVSAETSDLYSSCAALDLHFSNSLLFRQLLEQLVNTCQSGCSKDASAALNSKVDGNAALRNLKYGEALSSYTKALRYAPYTAKEEDKSLLAILFVNRAATLHKLKHFEPALRDCGRAIDVYPSYSKAWYRRSKIKCDMDDLEGAASDMREALAREKTGNGRKQIEKEIPLMEAKLTTRSSFPQNSTRLLAESKTLQPECPPDVEHLQLQWSDEKGWDLRTTKELDIGSLVFQEEAYAAIVLKPNRDTHCHFCFEVLPTDPVGCYACAIPMYCSELCRVQASSRYRAPSSTLDGNHEAEGKKSAFPSNMCLGEHTHECGGCAWSVVLPTDAVLAARILFRSAQMAKILGKETSQIAKDESGDKLCLSTRTSSVDTLCSNYERLSSNEKLEMHVLGVVVAHCVQESATPFLKARSKAAAKVASKLVLLIAQTRVNVMAIYGMSSPDPDISSADIRGSSTPGMAFCMVEQVKVAQGLFLLGSSLNHSCVPNVHASFNLRRLLLHSVSTVSAGSPLELCYGPEVGHMGQLERRNILQEGYYFTCKCSACARVTSSDLFLRSFRCIKQGCMGVVLSADLNDLFPSSEKLAPTSYSSTMRDKEFLRRGLVREANKSGNPLESHGACSFSLDMSLNETHLSENVVQNFSTETSVHTLPDTTSNEVSKKLTCKSTAGRCLDCGTLVDVVSAQQTASTALSHLQRIETKMLIPNVQASSLNFSLNGALDALDKLKGAVHPYNEQLAKGEDIVAQLFCALNQPLQGLRHCENAIQILEQLYNKHHIVLGNEYLKLASVALTVPDMECARRSLLIADYIFRVYYGSDYRQRMPYITQLHRLVHRE